MTCGAALYFDEQTDAAVRGLWQIIEDAGLPSNMLGLNFPPHMSILVCEDNDVESLRKTLPEFIALHPPLALTFHSLGVFAGGDGVVYLAPTPTRELLQFHAGLWDLIAPHSTNPNPLYSPGMWVPHVTLDLDVPEELVGEVVHVLTLATLPTHGLVREIMIGTFDTETPRFEEFFKARLGEYL